MITIELSYPRESRYREASQFAQSVYKKRLRSVTPATPDLFACARQSGSVIGCLGLYRSASRREFLFELCRPAGAIERLVGASGYRREAVGELGTRAVAVPRGCGFRSAEVSAALIGTLALAAPTLGIRYLGFVTNAMIKPTIESLGFGFVMLGQFDLSGADQAFRENMKGFVAVRQICAGFRIDSLERCKRILSELAERGMNLA